MNYAYEESIIEGFNILDENDDIICKVYSELEAKDLVSLLNKDKMKDNKQRNIEEQKKEQKVFNRPQQQIGLVGEPSITLIGFQNITIINKK